jgi:hypothetical protein
MKSLERRTAWEQERNKPCQCRSCTVLRFEHVDVHLRNNQPSPWCYQCRKDFAGELNQHSL